MRALLLALLLALPCAARALTGEDCRAGLDDYGRKPTVAGLRALLPCLDDPDPAVRGLAYDKLCRREVWLQPGFDDAASALRAAVAKGWRDPDSDVKMRAYTMGNWLDNAKLDEEQRARAAAAAAAAGRTELASPVERDRLRLSLVFGAGAMTQALIFILQSGASPLGLVWALGAGLFGLLPGKHESEYEPHFHVAYGFVIAVFVALAQYKDEIMARVCESSLLVTSLTFWYLCASFLDLQGRGLLLALAALPTLGTLAAAFTMRDWSFSFKLAGYVWFLVLTAANTCFQLGFGNLSFLFVDAYVPPKPVDLFLTGMAFTVLAASLFYIYILVPIPDKHEALQERMERWRRDAHAMAGSFADYALTPGQALQIVLLQGGFYLVNRWAGWFLPSTMMNVSMVVLPLGFRALLGLRRAPPVAGPQGDVLSPDWRPQ